MHGITRCYLPPGRDDIPVFTQANWKNTKVVYPSKIDYPSQYYPGSSCVELGRAEFVNETKQLTKVVGWRTASCHWVTSPVDAQLGHPRNGRGGSVVPQVTRVNVQPARTVGEIEVDRYTRRHFDTEAPAPTERLGAVCVCMCQRHRTDPSRPQRWTHCSRYKRS